MRRLRPLNEALRDCPSAPVVVAAPVYGHVRILVDFIIESDKLYFTCIRKKNAGTRAGRKFSLSAICH